MTARERRRAWAALLAAVTLIPAAGCQIRRDFRATGLAEGGSRLDRVEREAPLFAPGTEVRLAWSDAVSAPALPATVTADGAIAFQPILLLRLGVRRAAPAEVFFVLSDQRAPLEAPFPRAEQQAVLARWALGHRALFAKWREHVADEESAWEELFEAVADGLEANAN